MENGHFIAYSFHMMRAAVERYKTDPDVRMACPTSQLKRLLKTYQADSQALRVQIQEAVAVYRQQNRGSFPSSSDEDEDTWASDASKVPTNSAMEGGPLSNTPKVKPNHTNPKYQITHYNIEH